MKIPIKHIQQIFSQNIGQPINRYNKLVHILGSSLLDIIIALNNFEGNTLEKKSLSNLSDEDALILAGKDLGDNHDPKELIAHAKEKVKYFQIINMDLKSYQILHLLGYALPVTVIDEDRKVTTYSVKQLIEAGIYKII